MRWLNDKMRRCIDKMRRSIDKMRRPKDKQIFYERRCDDYYEKVR